ncbi:CoA transferase [Edwardsiella piscicida]|uniref:CoA transferase n=1 Tax=Edwardsiella piscicida TaxID=1263550 RepID=UPI003A5FE65B
MQCGIRLLGIQWYGTWPAPVGPFCGMLLADMATHVIKIETQEHGDDRRRFASFIHGESA